MHFFGSGIAEIVHVGNITIEILHRSYEYSYSCQLSFLAWSGTSNFDTHFLIWYKKWWINTGTGAHNYCSRQLEIQIDACESYTYFKCRSYNYTFEGITYCIFWVCDICFPIDNRCHNFDLSEGYKPTVRIFGWVSGPVQCSKSWIVVRSVETLHHYVMTTSNNDWDWFGETEDRV